MIDVIIVVLVWVFPLVVVAAILWRAFRARGTRT